MMTATPLEYPALTTEMGLPPADIPSVEFSTLGSVESVAVGDGEGVRLAVGDGVVVGDGVAVEVEVVVAVAVEVRLAVALAVAMRSGLPVSTPSTSSWRIDDPDCEAKSVNASATLQAIRRPATMRQRISFRASDWRCFAFVNMLIPSILPRCM
jgi:hypothetical protein